MLESCVQPGERPQQSVGFGCFGYDFAQKRNKSRENLDVTEKYSFSKKKLFSRGGRDARGPRASHMTYLSTVRAERARRVKVRARRVRTSHTLSLPLLSRPAACASQHHYSRRRKGGRGCHLDPWLLPPLGSRHERGRRGLGRHRRRRCCRGRCCRGRFDARLLLLLGRSRRGGRSGLGAGRCRGLCSRDRRRRRVRPAVRLSDGRCGRHSRWARSTVGRRRGLRCRRGSGHLLAASSGRRVGRRWRDSGSAVSLVLLLAAVLRAARHPCAAPISTGGAAPLLPLFVLVALFLLGRRTRRTRRTAAAAAAAPAAVDRISGVTPYIW